MTENKSLFRRFSKQTIIGIVGAVTIALFIWFAFFLKGRNILSSENTYYAIYDNAGGIGVSSPILLNGLKIGRVSSVDFVSDSDRRIKMSLEIERKYKIPENSIASLESTSLLGGSGIIIKLGNSPDFKSDNSYFASKSEPGLLQQLAPLKEQLFSIVNSLDSILYNVNNVLSPTSVASLQNSFIALNNSLKNIEKISVDAKDLVDSKKDRIGSIIDNLDEISILFKQNSSKIENVIANLSNISDTIAQAKISQTLSSLSSSMQNLQGIMNKLENGEGSAGQLLNNPEFYNNLESSTAQLKLLLEDIRLNPGRYIHISVFGKKDKTPPVKIKSNN